MNIFVESHVKRKLHLLSTLYFRKKEISIVELSSILKVSENTVKNDLIKYHLICKNGDVLIDIDKDLRLKLYYEIMDESIIAKIFRMILKDPGKRADYYSRTLAISRAYFYKVIIALNNELQKFGARISVSNGYHVLAENERQFRLYIFFYFLSTNTELNPDINQMYRVFPDLLAFNGIEFPFLEQIEYWEDYYHVSFLFVNIVRQSTIGTTLDFEAYKKYEHLVKLPEKHYNTIRSLFPNATRRSVIESLILFARFKQIRHSLVSVEDVSAIIDIYTKTCTITIEDEKRDVMVKQLVQILSLMMHVAQHFPFNTNHFSVVMRDFYCEYGIINQELIKNYSTFIDITSERLKVDFRKLKVFTFYLIVMNAGDKLFVPHKKILFASRGTGHHLEHSKHELTMVLEMAKVNPDITIVPLSQLRRELNNGVYDLVFSESKLEGVENLLMVQFSNSLLIMELAMEYFRGDYQSQYDLIGDEL